MKHIPKILLSGFVITILLTSFNVSASFFAFFKKPTPAEPLITTPPPPPPPTYATPEFMKEFMDEVKTIQQTWTVPGLAVAVVENGQIISARGFGVRDFTSNAKVNKHTTFQLASLSKTFSAVLLGLLADQKKLSLDDPVTKYLPDLLMGSPEQTKKITIRHLLNHSTGFPGHSGDVRVEGGESFSQIIKSFSNLKILNEPGKVHAYQNVIYSLSAKIIEKVTGMSFGQAMRTYIFNPAQMTSASVGRKAFRESLNRALPFRYTGGQHKQIPVSYDYYSVPGAAGLNASIADAAQWLKFVMGTIPTLPPENIPVMTLETLQSLQKASISSPCETSRMRPYRERVTHTSYGLGFRTSDWAGHRIVYHGGMVNGMKSLLAFDPQKKVGLVILMNSNSAALGIIRSHFFDRLYGLKDINWNQRFKEQELKAATKKKSYRKSRKRRTKTNTHKH